MPSPNSNRVESLGDHRFPVEDTGEFTGGEADAGAETADSMERVMIFQVREGDTLDLETATPIFAGSKADWKAQGVGYKDYKIDGHRLAVFESSAQGLWGEMIRESGQYRRRETALFEQLQACYSRVLTQATRGMARRALGGNRVTRI